MQQALYDEPKRARLPGRMGCLYTPSGIFPFTAALGSAPAQIVPRSCPPVLNRQCPQVPLTNTGQPLWQTVTMAVLHYSRTKARLADPAKDLGNSKTISPSTFSIKYASADACPETVGSS